MVNCEITLDIEQTPWRDLEGQRMSMWDIVRMGRLPRGTTSGKSTVTVLMRHRTTGTLCMGETTLALFDTAAGALKTADTKDLLTGQPPEPKAMVAKLADLLARITNVVSKLDSDKVPYESPEQAEYTATLLQEANVACDEAAGM